LVTDVTWNVNSGLSFYIDAIYSNGATTTVVSIVRYESDPLSSYYKPASLDETIRANLRAPADAISVQLRFSASSGNNWWVGIDNVQVVEDFVLLDEDFDNVKLNTKLDENVDGEYWSHSLPAGWTSTNVGTAPGTTTLTVIEP
jgi:hypothetical protein